MRILQVVYQMNRGGVETWLMHVMRNINRERFQFDFLTHTPTPGDYDEEIRSLGGSVFHCCRPAIIWRYGREFRRILGENGPYDVIHSHSPLWDGPAIKIAKEMNVAVRIVHSHTDTSRALPRNILKRLYLRKMIRTGNSEATLGLGCSRLAAASYFGEDWPENPRRRVLFCGESFEPFDQKVDSAKVRGELGILETALVIGHVGSFRDEYKNHRFLIGIAAEAARFNPNIRLLLVGDGVLRSSIERLAVRLGIQDRVVFAGLRNDVPRLMLGAMDLFLFPSIYEGLGLALVEAQAAGLPCVCSEAIPHEAEIIPALVRRLSLELPAAAWAKAAMDHLDTSGKIDRKSALQLVKESGFNLERSLNELEMIYSGA